MGTRAHWFRSPWRYRTEDGSWTYAPTLRDIREDMADSEETVTIQKRERDEYLPYGTFRNGKITKEA